MATNLQCRTQLISEITAWFTTNGVTCRTYLDYMSGYVEEQATPLLMATERQVANVSDFAMELTISIIILVRFRQIEDERESENQLSEMVENVMTMLQDKTVINRNRNLWKSIEVLGKPTMQHVKYGGHYKQGHIMITIRK
jgi:hypothetical protein